jgi:hypothetical protein
VDVRLVERRRLVVEVPSSARPQEVVEDDDGVGSVRDDPVHLAADGRVVVVAVEHVQIGDRQVGEHGGRRLLHELELVVGRERGTHLVTGERVDAEHPRRAELRVDAADLSRLHPHLDHGGDAAVRVDLLEDLPEQRQRVQQDACGSGLPDLRVGILPGAAPGRPYLGAGHSPLLSLRAAARAAAVARPPAPRVLYSCRTRFDRRTRREAAGSRPPSPVADLGSIAKATVT